MIIFDGLGRQYLCLIKELSDKVTLEIQKKDRASSIGHRASSKLTIACAIPKKSKIDDIIDKLTQLGVDKIIPLKTERVVVKLDKNKIISRLKRWEKIALSAAEQSKRNNIPIISPIKELKEVLAEAGEYDLKLIPTLSGDRKTLKEVLNRVLNRDSDHFSRSRKMVAVPILVLIGPEGDFSPGEVELARKAGCIPVTLGDLVFRVETAAVAVASFIKLYNYALK